MRATYFMLLEIRDGVRTNPTGRGKVPRIMVLQCDVCGLTYERPYSKCHFSEPINRCSRKCVYGSRSTDGLGGHGAEIIEAKCLACQTLLRFRKAGGERKWGKTCSRECYGAYRSQHPELYVDNTTAMYTPEAAQKISGVARRRMSTPGYVHPMQGKHHSEETKTLISKHHVESGCLSGEKNGMYGKHHSGVSRAKMSDTRSRLFIEGKIRCYPGNSRSGTYVSDRTQRKFHFKSGWEEAVMKHLDSSPDVRTWDYECVRIPYYYNDNKRWYVPDFVITYQDGHREMWEVKPKFHRNAEQVKLKAEAARAWCEQNAIAAYQLLTDDVLKERGIIP